MKGSQKRGKQQRQKHRTKGGKMQVIKRYKSHSKGVLNSLNYASMPNVWQIDEFFDEELLLKLPRNCYTKRGAHHYAKRLLDGY
jgi:hypothetical protein